VAKEKNKNRPTEKNQVGKIYVCGKGNKIYYKTLQEYKLKNSLTTNNNLGKLLSTQTAQKRTNITAVEFIN